MRVVHHSADHTPPSSRIYLVYSAPSQSYADVTMAELSSRQKLPHLISKGVETFPDDGLKMTNSTVDVFSPYDTEDLVFGIEVSPATGPVTIQTMSS